MKAVIRHTQTHSRKCRSGSSPFGAQLEVPRRCWYVTLCVRHPLYHWFFFVRAQWCDPAPSVTLQRSGMNRDSEDVQRVARIQATLFSQPAAASGEIFPLLQARAGETGERKENGWSKSEKTALTALSPMHVLFLAAAPEFPWFHQGIDRMTAEYRLRAAGRATGEYAHMVAGALAGHAGGVGWQGWRLSAHQPGGICVCQTSHMPS